MDLKKLCNHPKLIYDDHVRAKPGAPRVAAADGARPLQRPPAASRGRNAFRRDPSRGLCAPPRDPSLLGLWVEARPLTARADSCETSPGSHCSGAACVVAGFANCAAIFENGHFDEAKLGRDRMAPGWEACGGKFAVLARLLEYLRTFTNDRIVLARLSHTVARSSAPAISRCRRLRSGRRRLSRGRFARWAGEVKRAVPPGVKIWPNRTGPGGTAGVELHADAGPDGVALQGAQLPLPAPGRLPPD